MGIELHTERLARELGAPIVANVRLHDRIKGRRLVLLESFNHHRRRRTPQSVAFTQLRTSLWDSAIHAVDKQLESGGLMGETFRKHGYNVQQRRLLHLRLPILNPRIARLYERSIWHWAEVECYEFWAGTIHYGTVLEIKHPDRGPAPPRPNVHPRVFGQRFRDALRSITLYFQTHRVFVQVYEPGQI